MAFDDMQKKMMAAQLNSQSHETNKNVAPTNETEEGVQSYTEIKIPNISVKRETTKPTTYTLTPTSKDKLAYIAEISGLSASKYITAVAKSGFDSLSEEQKAAFDKWRKKKNRR